MRITTTSPIHWWLLLLPSFSIYSLILHHIIKNETGLLIICYYLFRLPLLFHSCLLSIWFRYKRTTACKNQGKSKTSKKENSSENIKHTNRVLKLPVLYRYAGLCNFFNNSLMSIKFPNHITQSTPFLASELA